MTTTFRSTRVVTTAPPPTNHRKLLGWVAEVAALTEPKAVRWCDGSEEEWAELTSQLVETGTLIPLNPVAKPNSFLARTDPDDVARVEDRTFICSVDPQDAGPTNNWMAPEEMKRLMTNLFRGCMAGRTMYVIPFCMGPLNADQPMFGVEITDSAYVVLSMKIMTRMGAGVLSAMTQDGEADFVPCLHSVGRPLAPYETDVAWPCSETKYITHFPEERTIWSYGSGYGGNSLLGKKCYSLRIASSIGRKEGWLAEHMLIIKLTAPGGRSYHLAAAFPSACGKTNLAMMEPTIQGWTVETLGDDIAWMRFGPDGRLYAHNPEFGLFGVAPGTGWRTNPNAMRAMKHGNSLFTNVALTDDGDVWWEGATTNPPPHLIDWQARSWTPEVTPGNDNPHAPAAHPNSRFCTPITQCPSLSEDYDNPAGVPIDAILFGGRRQDTLPLVTQARDWPHGVFLGATISSETTAAAAGQTGIIRRDPMAMLPFIGYHVGDYLAHWLSLGERQQADRLPAIFYVNWFRKSPEGNFLWPGFGENSRVLKWVVERLHGAADAVETPIGHVPTVDSLDTSGSTLTHEQLVEALAVDEDAWRAEIPRIEEWFGRIGAKLPAALQDEVDSLKLRLSA